MQLNLKVNHSISPLKAELYKIEYDVVGLLNLYLALRMLRLMRYHHVLHHV